MTKFTKVDLVRLSQDALKVAKPFDKDNSGSLEEEEYNNFINIWGTEKSPLLMQLHMSSLSPEALELAKQCDGMDNFENVLTEGEIDKFIKLCKEHNIETPFKKGVTLAEVLTGKPEKAKKESTQTDRWSQHQQAVKGFLTSIFGDKELPIRDSSGLGVRVELLKNWLKLDIMGYKGSDKFFHAVGNFEAMKRGYQSTVEEVCAGQDEDKRNNMQRPEADYTEDLYANWLGREFEKMYPTADPHELFAPLAPKGFDVNKSKKSVVKLMIDANKNNDEWLNKKIKQYGAYFGEGYIQERFVQEIKDTL